MSIAPGRITGLILVAGGVVAFGAAYSWLLGARAEAIVGQAGFGIGLLICLAIVMPVLAAGIHLMIHGDPDINEHRRQRAARSAIETARSGWADLWPLLKSTDVSRGELAKILADEAASQAFAGYVDWRKGALVPWPGEVPASECPACRAPLPSATPRAPLATPTPPVPLPPKTATARAPLPQVPPRASLPTDTPQAQTCMHCRVQIVGRP